MTLLDLNLLNEHHDRYHNLGVRTTQVGKGNNILAFSSIDSWLFSGIELSN